MNMQAVGRIISAKRKERDMTQVDLADKLGVTYQAVSGWERGHSMPDIAKLPDISQVLEVSIDELLGNAAAATFVKSMLTGQEPQVPDAGVLANVAPILKPSQIETLTDSKSFASEAFLVEMACHLDSEKIKEIVLKCDGIESKTIEVIACFLNSEDLKDIALHCQNLNSKTIEVIACFMNSEDLKDVALHCQNLDSRTIEVVACFMNSEDLKEVALHYQNIESRTIAKIACHMNSEDLKEIAMNCQNIDAKTIEAIACHMDSDDLKEVIMTCKNLDSKTIAHIACHLDEDDLAEIIMGALQNRENRGN